MTKHIVILNGSPRQKGNTSTLITWLKQELQRAKYKVRQHDLYYLDFKGCKHCDACKKIATKPGCILQDDLTNVLDDIVSSDIIVIASPVYCWSFSGCMSAALDRFYSLFKRGAPCLFANKKIIGLFTANGDYFDGMELCVSGLKEIARYGQAQYAGTISAIFCEDRPINKQKTRLTEDIKNLMKELNAAN